MTVAEYKKWADAAEEAIELLENTFEGDPKRSHYPRLVRDAYESMVGADNPIAWRLGAMYAQWCALNPGQIEGDVFSRCSCSGGFKIVDGNRYRPCNTCLPKTFESWQKESGHGYDGEV